LGQADYRLLAELGRQAGAHAHAVQLTTNLRRSQQRLMVAREEERRRLRRDLHDGLGPMLAGVRLGLEEVRRSMPKGHAAAAALACLGDQAQGAASELRRLINDPRPTLLDEVGLVEALKQQAAHFSSPSGDPAGLEVTVGVPEMLGPLPAAVELAAYRIATEALANVARHAKSAPCTIRLYRNGVLQLRIEDDGIGIGGSRLGVGIPSMREHAAAVEVPVSSSPAPPGHCCHR
jgi:signal transduction histidine kinase